MEENAFKRQPPRLLEDGTEYFLTFNTFKRRNLLCRKNIPELILDCIKFSCKKYNLNRSAYVILPDHVHVLLKCLKAKDVSKFLISFKTFTSKEIKRILGIKDKIIWQRGTYDHVIEDEDDYWNHLDYIHYNPVKHEYVSKPEKWKWVKL